MKQHVKMSRRQWLSSVGSSALLAPMCYPLLSEAAIPDVRPASQAPAASDRGMPFLTRDFMSSRLELVRLLKEITEVEHSLMLQYLYAGFSLKPSFSALAGNGAPDSHSFIGVAIQEMQHLSSVNKLLVALGASPYLETQDFPFEAEIYPFPMQLEALSRESVAKYAYCEASVGAVSMDNKDDAQFVHELHDTVQGVGRINHIGSVYGIMIDLLDDVRKHDQGAKLDFDYWLAELTRIMDEGEEDHFKFFRSVFMGTHPAFKASPQWWQLNPQSDAYPAFAIASNPSAYGGHPNQIQDDIAQKMAWLSNLNYWSTLVLLDLYYQTGDDALKYLSINVMLSSIKSMGTALAKRGYGLPFDHLSLGYSPSRAPADNLGFAIQLQQEAQLIRKQIEPHLPTEYPDTMELVCIQQLRAIGERWAHKDPRLAPEHSVFVV